MDRRTFEGPMDWEYQDTGPLDATSPFASLARNNHNAFNSPSKSSSRLNPFANLSSPSKPPQSALFSPQIGSRNNAAAPFRNPAFTTPRKPHDELVLSEASGAEDSPALTDHSDYPNDTPEVDRMGDVTMGGTFGPSKVDKAMRYGKATPFAKKHASGKGEIRSRRDYSVADMVRKRKRHNQDRDVSSGVMRALQDWEDSDAESDASFASPSKTRSKPNKKDIQRTGVGSWLHMLDEHPNAPENLFRWIQLGVNVLLVLVVMGIGWTVVDAVRFDIRNANEAARMELQGKMTECATQYQLNECVKKDRPALQAMCNEWYECMMQNPESIMRVKVTAKQVAEIINEFSESMNLKAWVFFIAILLVCAFANNMTLGRSGHGNKGGFSGPPQPSGVPHDPAMSPDGAAGYMWVPVQTPRRQRHQLLDEGTDTDNTPPKMQAIMSPYVTARRSPSKGERSRSPVKYALSPTKRREY